MHPVPLAGGRLAPTATSLPPGGRPPLRSSPIPGALAHPATHSVVPLPAPLPGAAAPQQAGQGPSARRKPSPAWIASPPTEGWRDGMFWTVFEVSGAESNALGKLERHDAVRARAKAQFQLSGPAPAPAGGA
jgi:hypothetical protein